MTTEQITKSLETGELQLKFWDKLQHYGIVVFMFFIPTVIIFTCLKAFFCGTAKPALLCKFILVLFILIPSILGVLFYWIQKNRLKFTSIETNLNRKELNGIIEKVAKELEWKSRTSNDRVYIAETNPGFLSGSWGEQITILFDHNKILVNSICRLDARMSVVSWSRNRENVKTLIDEINNAVPQ